jgi:phosphoribosylaminoimidazole synthetase
MTSSESALGVALDCVEQDDDSSDVHLGSLYAETGVFVDDNTRLIPAIREIARKTRAATSFGGAVGEIGASSGQFRVEAKSPMLAASTDSVGTKVLIARMAGRYDTVGQDLVNHCVNDILTSGARPLFFLDYLACNGLALEQKKDIISGLALACAENGTVLIGGETADLPDVYAPGVFDIAGTIVGIVESGSPIDGSTIESGDVLIGLPSNGLHTNGYSLVRSLFELDSDVNSDGENQVKLATFYEELGGTLVEELLKAHRSYLPDVRPVLKHCKGIAHITGGGSAENIERVLPEGCGAIVDCTTWESPPIFQMIQGRGVRTDEMYRVFNMGLGMVLVVAPDDADGILGAIDGAWRVGGVVPAAEVSDTKFRVRLKGAG